MDSTREETTIFGYLIRGKAKQKLLIEGKVDGTRCRGKQRRTRISDMMDWCIMSYAKCTRMAESRKEYVPSAKKRAPTVTVSDFFLRNFWGLCQPVQI